ncbi:MAG: hypothetical protein JNJ63_10485 [Hyphomonadaceae bacterium]|nr:hypothetical protein [Hyphomonadaceae bacterium]
MQNHKQGATILVAAAAAWPSASCAIANAMATPYERALSSSWCGAMPLGGPVLLGHAPVCWAGAMLLAAAGAYLYAFGEKLRLATQRA